MATFQIHTGDALEVASRLEGGSVQTVVTSPPYFGLRDYKTDGQLGQEQTPELYVERLVSIFREVRRVMRPDATLWLNIGDSYANDSKWGGRTGGKHTTALHGGSGIGREKRTTGLGSKQLIGVPWRVAFALQADGWVLRSDVIWNKPNPMPEPVDDRPTKAHEYLFLLAVGPHYYYNAEAIKEPFADERMGNPGAYKKTGAAERKACNDRQDLGFINNGGGWNADGAKQGRNKRSVWTVPTVAFPGAHFATFPPELIKPCILAGSKEGDTVFDPFIGSGTTALVALRHHRNFIGAELNPEYVEMARRRIRDDAPMFNVEIAA